MNKRMLLPVILVAIVTFVSFEAHAQVGESTGNIVGLVENKGEGTYTVNATEPSTGRSRTATVGADGTFRFSQLPIGQYEVTVSKDGKVVARDTFPFR